METFNLNGLNELTTIARNVTNALTVAGTTSSSATSVTVNANTAILYSDYTFASSNAFTITNGNNTFTAIAGDALGRSDTNAITVNLPATNSYTYDLNGNLTSDGTRAFSYDDENELIRCLSRTSGRRLLRMTERCGSGYERNTRMFPAQEAALTRKRTRCVIFTMETW